LLNPRHWVRPGFWTLLDALRDLSSAPVLLWASKRSRIVDPTSQDFSWENRAPSSQVSQVKSSYKSPIIHFELYKEQQHSQKQVFSWLWCSWSSSGFSSRLVWLYVFFHSFCSFCPLIWVFRVCFCSHEGTVPYRSVAQMSCRKEVGVSFVVIGVLEPQIARHWLRSAAISRHLVNSVGRSLLWRAFFIVRPQFTCGHPRGRGLSTQLVKIFLGARTIRHRISSASLFKRLSIELFDTYYNRRQVKLLVKEFQTRTSHLDDVTPTS
jgi:hypothetical protein